MQRKRGSMQDLSVDDLIKKLWRYKFAQNTTMAKIAEELGYNACHLSKMIGNKKQMSSVGREKLIWFLSKKEQENNETY